MLLKKKKRLTNGTIDAGGARQTLDLWPFLSAITLQKWNKEILHHLGWLKPL